MDPLTLSALIGLGSNLLGKGIEQQGAEDRLPASLLASLNPGQNLQTLESSFAIPGMQQVKSPGQRILGGF